MRARRVNESTRCRFADPDDKLNVNFTDKLDNVVEYNGTRSVTSRHIESLFV